MAKIVQVNLDNKRYYAYRRFNWKLFRFEYLDVKADDGWHNTWWIFGSSFIHNCLFENKDDLEIAMGWKARKPIEEDISELTQIILKAIEQRSDDFLFSKYESCGEFTTTYVIDKKTKLKLTKIRRREQISFEQTNFYSNNKDVEFTEHEYKLIEKKLDQLAKRRMIEEESRRILKLQKENLIRHQKEKKVREQLIEKFQQYEVSS